MFTPPLKCRDPVAIGPRRVMSDVLLMPALPISHPIEAFVLMKPNNLSWNPTRYILLLAATSPLTRLEQSWMKLPHSGSTRRFGRTLMKVSEHLMPSCCVYPEFMTLSHCAVDVYSP